MPRPKREPLALIPKSVYPIIFADDVPDADKVAIVKGIIAMVSQDPEYALFVVPDSVHHVWVLVRKAVADMLAHRAEKVAILAINGRAGGIASGEARKQMKQKEPNAHLVSKRNHSEPKVSKMKHTPTPTSTHTGFISTSFDKPEEEKEEGDFGITFVPFEGKVSYESINNPYNDPVAMTLRICGVCDQRNYNAFAKLLKIIGDASYRNHLDKFVGEIDQGECANVENLAALFTTRLQAVAANKQPLE